MTLAAGSRLGPYEIVAPIGAGGMGEVWRARDPRLGRDVAIKVLPASFSADADRLRRFEQEARAAGVLNHPNITAVFDIGEHKGAPYVVQELLEGETLRQALAGGRLPARKAIDYAIQIAHGLAAAHEKGIVHRDLKPIGWFDLTYPAALSDDGKTILFTEESTSAGASYSACIRGTDGSPVVRLGDGAALDLSADGKWALASIPTRPRLVLYPTGAGQPKTLDRASIEGYEFGQLTPDGSRVVFCGHEAGHADRCYIQDIPAGKPQALTAPGRNQAFVSPDGRRIAAEGPSGLEVVSVDGGVPTTIPGSTLDDSIIRWGADSRSLLVGPTWQVPVRVERLDVATGKRELVRVLGPPDLLGAIQILPVVFSSDERSYSYSTRRMHSLLFAIEGAR